MKVSLEKIFRISFFLYFIGYVAFNRGYGFDAFFCRATFGIMIGCEIICVSSGKKWNSYSVNKTVQMMVLFILFYFISVIWAKNLKDVFYYVNDFLQISFVVIIVSRHIKTKNDLESYLKLILGGWMYMVTVLVIRTPVSAWGSERVGSVMALNANEVGMYCATAFLLTLYFAQKNKMVYILGGVFAVISLFSGSRKSFVMIVASCCIFLGLVNRGFKRIKNFILIMVCVISLFSLIMSNEKFYDVIGYRMEKTIDALMGKNVKDGSAKERAYYREHAVEMFLEKPIIGVGGNGFVTRLRLEGYWHVAYSHCNYTELLATLGIIGFSLYYGIQLRILIRSLHYFKNKRDTIYLLVITFLLINLMTEYYVVSYISVVQQLMIALCGIAVDKMAIKSS